MRSPPGVAVLDTCRDDNELSPLLRHDKRARAPNASAVFTLFTNTLTRVAFASLAVPGQQIHR